MRPAQTPTFRIAGIEALNLPREEILFVAFAGWDAAGAKSFGYPTFWVNRLGLPPEELDVLPDATGTNLNDLLAFVG
jgi:2-haloacid dehalogenase